MAEANTKATIISNLDSVPPVKNSVNLMGAVLREQVGTVEIAAADDASSVYRVARVHTSWRLSEVSHFNDAITSGTDYDVGFYDTAANGGAVINVNAIADAVSLASGSLTPVQVLFEGSSDTGVEDIEQAVWQMAGLTSDPGKFVDLCYTGVAPGSGAGTLSVRTRYVANS